MDKLTKLGKKHNTDKATRHGYTKIYHDLFSKYENDDIKILEIGADLGASHMMWKDYFVNGKVYCLDPFFTISGNGTPTDVIKTKLENEGIIVHKGNMLNREDNEKIAEMADYEFDFIVEDAAHVSDATQMALGSLFPYLKSGGMYIIEDISTAIRRTYGKINAWLKDGHGLVNDGAKENGHYCVNSLGIYHKQEFHIHDTLKGFTETGKWNSKLLNDKEKQYLSDNISKWDLPHRNLILIHKK